MQNLCYEYSNLHTIAVQEGGLQVIPEEFDRLKKAVTYRFLCVEEGSCNLFLSGVSCELNKTDLCFFCPNDVYRTVPIKTMQVINIYFSFDREDVDALSHVLSIDQIPSIQRYEISDISVLNTPFVIKNFPDGINIARQMKKEIMRNRSLKQKQLDLHLENLMLNVLRHFEHAETHRQENKQQLMISELTNYIKSHIHERLSCQDIASAIGYHPNYLNEIIQKANGIPLHRFILEQKIKCATSDLMSSDKTITQIAQEYAFYDSSHFNKCYYQITGLRPSDVRKAAR